MCPDHWTSSSAMASNPKVTFGLHPQMVVCQDLLNPAMVRLKKIPAATKLFRVRGSWSGIHEHKPSFATASGDIGGVVEEISQLLFWYINHSISVGGNAGSSCKSAT